MVEYRGRRLFSACHTLAAIYLGVLPFDCAEQAVMCRALTPRDRCIVCQYQVAFALSYHWTCGAKDVRRLSVLLKQVHSDASDVMNVSKGDLEDP
jgi:hypothetical protein